MRATLPKHFEDYLIGFKAKCEGMRVLLVLDNIRIHYAKKLNPIYYDAFKVLFLSPYSSPLNPLRGSGHT